MPGQRAGAGVAGEITRGTTHQNRLRRVDRWILAHAAPVLRANPRALVIDLGFGRVPQTTIELAARLRAVTPTVDVVGLEIDPARVADALVHTRAGLTFRRGGFELAGLGGASLIRAMNVLRQYDEERVVSAWSQLAAGLAASGFLLEGTSDELGRICSWVALRRGPGHEPGMAAVPEALMFSAQLSSLGDPARFAERLPKALIHRNVPGEGIHALLTAWSAAWARAATPFGPRVRFVAAAHLLREQGWPLLGGPARWRLGEVGVRWGAVAPQR